MNISKEEFLQFSEEVLGIKNLSETDDFIELRLDSIQMAKYINKINKDFAKSITIIDMFEYPSVEKLFSKIRLSEAPVNSNFRVVNFSEEISTTKDFMFFIAPVTGESNSYGHIAKKFIKKYNCIGLQPIEEVDFTAKSIYDLCQIYLNEIENLKISDSRRIIIVGYSMGGMIGFELVKKIKNPIKQLILIDVVPKTKKSHSIFQEGLDDMKMVNKLISLNELMSGYKFYSSEEEKETFVKMIERNFDIVRNYQITSDKIDNTILAIAADTTFESMKDWKNYTDNHFECYQVPNTNHLNLMNEVDTITKMMKSALTTEKHLND